MADETFLKADADDAHPDDAGEPPARFSNIDWKGRTSALLSTLGNSAKSVNTEGVAEGTTHLVGGVITAGGNTVKNGHILRLRAGITVWERDILQMKHKFGLELYAIMDRNRNMGDKSGGEAEPELVEVYTSCANNISALLELRKRKHTELLKLIKPEVICHQPTGDDTSEDMEKFTGSGGEEKEKEEATVTGMFSRVFHKGVDWTRTALENNQRKATLKTEIAELDKDIVVRKEQFGVDMYDTMEYLGDQYEPRDTEIRGLFASIKKGVDVPFLKILTAEKELEDVRATGSVLVSKEELQDYIDGKPQLWLILEANIQKGEDQCKMICIRVITELISGAFGKEARDALIRKRDFLVFESKFVDNPKGSQEFIHRCIFASFDADHNGILNGKETADFVDAFYKSGSVVQGSSRLPEQKDLMIMIRKHYNEDGDGEFTFKQIQDIIKESGENVDSIALEEMETKPSDDESASESRPDVLIM
ncbi:unnamed protein product [Cylindrotheca closterium]|uniref:EF-hand domain-containing protein n=1 Tax=Cylindrotheca closterium TaxID=2856 RepID=A0AAD2CLK5_9STRA|nr:unnamed protein product [Cylindrotheca closterium]